MTNERSSQGRQRRSPVREFLTHLVEMPRWHRRVLSLAGVVAILGLLGQTMAFIEHSQRPPAESAPLNSTAAPAPAPAGSRSFVSSSSTPAPERSADAPTSTVDSNDAPSLRDRLSPWATRVGGAFLGGFVIGWAFRAFLKTMALVTAAGVAILAVLSHFNVLNIDVERAQSGFQSTTSWVSQQAEHLKDRGMALFPGSMSGLAGMFVGFRRK